MEIKHSLKLHEAVALSFKMLGCSLKGKKTLVPYICSKPGAGKSDMLAQTCAKVAEKTGQKIAFVPITVGLIRVERFTGIPDFSQGTYKGQETLNTTWSVPEIVGSLREQANTADKVICLFDDWHIAPPEIQACAFELFTYFTINGYSIPREKVAFLLAGNASAAAGARNSFSAVMNRVAKIYCDPDFDYWRDEYAYLNDVDPAIVSFLDNRSYRPYFHGEEDSKEPWASPRSWAGLSVVKQELEQSGMDFSNSKHNGILNSLVCSHVGTEAGGKYMLYHTIYSKVNARKIFKEGKFTIPKDPIEKFAFGAACTNEFYHMEAESTKGKGHKKTFSDIINALEKDSPEIVIRSIKFLQGKDQNILFDLINEKIISDAALSRLMSVTKILSK